jgi:hypothetical protein
MPSIAISRQSKGNVVRCEELNDTVACFSRGTIASPGSPNLTVLKNVDEAGINSKAVQQITGFPMPEDCVPLSIKSAAILDPRPAASWHCSLPYSCVPAFDGAARLRRARAQPRRHRSEDRGADIVIFEFYDDEELADES